MMSSRIHNIFWVLLSMCAMQTTAQKLSATNDLKLVHSSQSKTAEHVVFDQHYLNIPILDAHLSLWFCADGDTMRHDSRKSWENVQHYDRSTHWYFDSFHRVLIGCEMKFETTGKGLELRVCRDINGQIRWKEAVKRYHIQPDTQVLVNVFYPNPVVSRNLRYGLDVSDQSDQDHPLLKEELRKESVRLLKKEDRILPATDNFAFKDVGLPRNDAPLITTDSLFFNRSHPDFEFFNILFHLQNFERLLKEKGYDKLIGKLVIDHNAMNGADQSAFNPFHHPPSLEFGKGGVDDGEDAHVIIHEMAHNLSFRAGGHTVHGEERRMMEEGLSDFLAMYYSKHIHPSTDNRVFSWDGHNEFWEGMVIDSDEIWNANLGLSMNQGRQIWSSCWNCIARGTGWETAFELALESMFFYRKHLSFSEMCSNILKIDSMLFGAKHYHALKHCFMQKGFMGGDYRDLSYAESNEIKLINSEGFARQGEDLWISFPQAYFYEYSIMDDQGRTILHSRSGYAKQLRIPNQLSTTGMYLLNVTTTHRNGNPAGSYQFKLMNGL